MEFLKRQFVHGIKFGLVGVSGAVLNLAIFWFLVDHLGYSPNLGSIAAFACAVSTNYLLNHSWTFRQEIAGDRVALEAYTRYVVVNIFGLGVNLAILNVFITVFRPPLYIIAQAVGIVGAMASNFVLSKLFVFRVRNHPAGRQSEPEGPK